MYRVPRGNMNVRDRQTHRWQAGLLCWTPPKKDRDTKRAHCRERACANIIKRGLYSRLAVHTLLAFQVHSSYLHAEKKRACDRLPSGGTCSGCDTYGRRDSYWRCIVFGSGRCSNLSLITSSSVPYQWSKVMKKNKTLSFTGSTIKCSLADQ